MRWYYEVQAFWTEAGYGGELMAFVHIHLFTKNNEKWSSPIVGVGGSALVAKESSGLRANDEAYKMALTDALSVAMKQLGVGSDIYMGRYDGSKYKDVPIDNKVASPNESGKSIPKDVFDSLQPEEQNFLSDIAMEMIAALSDDDSFAINALPPTPTMGELHFSLFLVNK